MTIAKESAGGTTFISGAPVPQPANEPAKPVAPKTTFEEVAQLLTPVQSFTRIDGKAVRRLRTKEAAFIPPEGIQAVLKGNNLTLAKLFSSADRKELLSLRARHAKIQEAINARSSDIVRSEWWASRQDVVAAALENRKAENLSRQERDNQAIDERKILKAERRRIATEAEPIIAKFRVAVSDALASHAQNVLTTELANAEFLRIGFAPSPTLLALTRSAIEVRNGFSNLVDGIWNTGEFLGEKL